MKRAQANWDFDSDRKNTGAKVIIWAILAILVTVTVWASRAEIDEVVTGFGRVIPSSQIQVVQNLEGGIVAEILAQEGDTVESGQILLRIDDTQAAASLRENKLRYATLTAKASRLRAEADDIEQEVDTASDYPGVWSRERLLFLARRAELRAKRAIFEQRVVQTEHELAELWAKRDKLQNSYNLANRELELTKPLIGKGVVSEVEVLRLERQVNDIQGELRVTRSAIPRIEAKHAEAKEQLADFALSFRNDARQQLVETMAELARLEEASVALKDRVTRTSVRSPVRGTVKRVFVHTVGGVVKPGMELVEIVPIEDTLLVEAKISPANIAFLHPGQGAVVKFTAYDYFIYGGLQARLEHISPDSIIDREGGSSYLVRVRTNKNYLGGEKEALPIIPGMTTYVDILTGKKTVLSYVMKPLLRAKEGAMRER